MFSRMAKERFRASTRCGSRSKGHREPQQRPLRPSLGAGRDSASRYITTDIFADESKTAPSKLADALASLVLPIGPGLPN